MAYADQKLSGNKITALIVVALLHIFIVYALVTGLAYSAYKEAVAKVTTVDIKEPEKPKEPPPPPPKQQDNIPPPVAPPVQIDIAPAPAQIQTVTTAPPVAPPIQLAPQAPAPPAPAPRVAASGATPKGDPQSWVSTDDYPSRSLREEKEGVVSFRLTVGTDGRVTDCTITSSSGTPELDQTTCSLMSRRGRFKPAVGTDGAAMTGSFVRSFRWQIPKD